MNERIEIVRGRIVAAPVTPTAPLTAPSLPGIHVETMPDGTARLLREDGSRMGGIFVTPALARDTLRLLEGRL